jgi:cell division septation protein DedD
MRIDYSEPKKSYVTTPVSGRPRKEPAGRLTLIIVVTGLATFAAGFGTGWFLSQRAAKKSFQAAMEQTSLESSPREESAPLKPAKPVPPPQPAAPMTSQQPRQQGDTAPPNGQTMPEPPLSFYKTLPSGQKNNVMGSGINAKEEKGKQPLQATIPSNVARQPQPGNEAAKPANEKSPAAAEKTARQDSAAGFTVQVASYTLKSEADAIRSKLTGKGYNVFITESNQGDKGTWYRVRVGRRLEQDAAKELCGKLGKGAIVIPDKE